MNPRTKGVTLIELLIAIALLSALSVGMLMALRVGITSMERSDARLLANRRVVSVQRILRSEIDGFMAAGADCVVEPGMPPVKTVFFEGRPQSMRFVSSYSLEDASRGSPRILELAVIPGDEGKGVRLIVNQFLYTGPQSTGAFCVGMAPHPETNIMLPQFRPIQPGPHSFVLADKLAYCRLTYRELRRPPELDRWLPEWPLAKWPTAVRIEMAPLEPDASRVPLVTATIPIHVNRDANVQYTE